jgi:transposase InsO family protein
VKEVIRKMGISEQTFSNWKKKYGGSGVSELRRLKQLEEENRQLKKLEADLSLVDNISRQCLGIRVDRGIKGDDVVSELEYLKATQGIPRVIFCDKGSEFVLKAMDKWAYENGVTLDISRPGKPMDNALVESFIGSFRDECLNVNWFLSLEPGG